MGEVSNRQIKSFIAFDIYCKMGTDPLIPLIDYLWISSINQQFII